MSLTLTLTTEQAGAAGDRRGLVPPPGDAQDAGPDR